MIGLLAIYGLIGLNIAAAVIVGIRKHGSFRQWWNS
jgi:hypothetical protein